MALDETILENFLDGKVPPTLRLYNFAPPAVSVGYAQKMSAADLRKLTDLGFEVVRRPSGGRAVLHMHDLTYAFIAPFENSSRDKSSWALPNGILPAYKLICQALIESIARLGISLELGKSQSPHRRGLPDCFTTITAADLHYNGEKIVGSAQLRRKWALLQHGSIILETEEFELAQLLNDNRAAPNIPATRRRGLFDIAGRSFTDHELGSAFKNGFEKTFGLSFVEGQLTSKEIEEARTKAPDYGVAMDIE
jgi:lipoate-protein ligase A